MLVGAGVDPLAFESGFDRSVLSFAEWKADTDGDGDAYRPNARSA